MNKFLPYLSIILFLFFTRCSVVTVNEYETLPPDDELSEIICNHFENNEYIYNGKSIYNDNNIICYRYINGNLDSDNITEFALALNGFENIENNKIVVNVCTPLSAGAALRVFALSNYSDENLDKPDYSGFYCITLGWDVSPAEAFLYDPLTYSQISDIRKLVIPDQMQEKADQEEIDWYEIWPDLEEVVVYKTDKYGNKID